MRRRFVAGVVACLLLFVAGCDWHLIVPSGPAPLRYRDQIFTSVTTTSNVVYGSAVNQQGVTVTLRLDVYQPTGDAAAARPAIVWIHGGSFRALNKTSPEIVDEATVFAKKGYVGVSIDYRLSTNGCTGGVTQECLTAITQAKEDAQAAVRFLRMNAATYHVDPNRIASAGTSAGAITALNVGYDPEHPGNSGNPGFLSSVRAAVSLSGAQLLTSPNAGEASALLFHGTADNLVPYQWAVNTINNAHAAGLDAFLTTWEGEGHVPYTEHRDQILGQTTNFLYWTLDVEHTGQ